MAIKYICDVCGKDITGKSKRLIQIGVHLLSANRGDYVDEDLEPVSGRDIDIMVCTKHYNEIMGPAVDKLKELIAEHNRPMPQGEIMLWNIKDKK